jgi:predicted Zn-dependent protease
MQRTMPRTAVGNFHQTLALICVEGSNQSDLTIDSIQFSALGITRFESNG